MSSELLASMDARNPGFALVPVTRANAAQIERWPATGWSGGYRWIGAAAGPDSPVIRTGDRLDLTIWDSQDNALLVPNEARATQMAGLEVTPQGTIFVPYLNEVAVRGKTPADARVAVQSALAPVMPSAQVQLTLAPGKQNSVDLVSGVARPGRYPLPDRNHSILSLIAEGGGIAASLRNPLVRLIRDGHTYEIRADRLFADASTNTTLHGGDKVLVEEDRRYFTALGATGAEDLIYFQKDDITALESLSIIGGLSDTRANPKGVVVLREYPAKTVRTDGSGPTMQQVVFTFDLTTAEGLFAARKFRINPKDTVLATESEVTSVRTLLGLLGSAAGLADRLEG
ncbi:polysaccharide biosynthesis/export family protein [Phaeovulum veldkampii]|nr:polysaccharide biosynthesis/export family protein [Phaeovulum veldkampii]TDQ57318.1 polysaccharide export outer membrane protein [Phaeovulum veldkampii DSM 11550]